jgi:signal transduction histidine kinase/CheY-like chemotaxis protein
VFSQTRRLRGSFTPKLRNGSLSELLAHSRKIAFVVTDADSNVINCNRCFKEVLGHSRDDDLRGINLRKTVLASNCDWNRWVDGNCESRQIEGSFSRKPTGSVTLSGELTSVCDASGELKAIEILFVPDSVDQLHRALENSSRMSSLGTLAAGIAHDFNNLLTIIVGNLYLLVEGVREDEDLVRKAKSARDAARRGANLCRQLLDFARRNEATSRGVQLGEVIFGMKPLLEPALGSRLSISIQVPDKLWLVDIDVGLFESALINLAINARDAIEAEGKLLIKAANEPARRNRDEASQEAMDYVRIDVIDNGPGIPSEIMDRVHLPFVSTKSRSGSAGLGLAMVRRLVGQSDGKIEIRSKKGKGTIVTLRFPRSRREGSSSDVVDATQPLSTLATGKESVLVMPHSAEVRKTLRELLETLGYSVTVSDIARYKELIDHDYDLIIVDVDSRDRPEIKGLSAAANSPAMLFLTGNADEPETFRGRKVHLLKKPFSLGQLATQVRLVLDQRGSTQ